MSEDLRKVQMIDKRILDSVVDICNRHSIIYFLAYGTLLGAVREKGFIPWDDDLDIFMLNDDLELFIKYAVEELPEKYIIQNIDFEPNCFEDHVRIRDKDTYYVDDWSVRCQYVNNGCWVDIYPLYNVGKPGSITNTIQRILGKEILHRMCNYRSLKDLDGLPFFKIFLHYFSCVLSVKQWSAIRKKVYLSSNNKKEYLSDFSAVYKADRVTWPRTLFEKSCELEFEGDLYNAPQNYDECLRTTYGDYMVLPPEEKRINHMPKKYHLS